MKHRLLAFSILLNTILLSCSNKDGEITPYNQLKQVDEFLSMIKENPQNLSAPTNRESTVMGKQGTVIRVIPNNLETIDSSPLGDKIEIELLEMVENSSLILNNAQTISNGEILITGGAYYLNMTSGGKQLRMKTGKGIEVEFPKLTRNEMSLFLGERDSVGEINWIQAEEKFRRKNLQRPVDPRKRIQKKTYNQIDLILAYADSAKSEPLTEEEIKEYERKNRQYEVASQTYRAIELLDFGWINCDRFLNVPGPKVDVQLLIKNDTLNGARIFAVFDDIKSLLTQHYWKGGSDTIVFQKIPVGREMRIIALSAKNETPFIFETQITVNNENQVEVNLLPATQEEVKKKILEMN